MKLTDRYLTRLFLQHYLAATAALVAIGLILEIVNLATLLAEGVAGRQAVTLFLWKIPPLYASFSPLATLLAGLSCCATMARHRENMVMESIGLHPMRAWFPAFLASFFLALLPFAVTETLGPRAYEATRRGAEITNPTLALPDFFLYAKSYRRAPDGPGYRDVNIILFHHEGTLREVYRAETAVPAPDGNWDLRQGSVVRFSPAGELEGRQDFGYAALDAGFPAAASESLLKPLESLSAGELAGYLRILKSAGLSPPAVKTVYYSRFAYPALNVVIILLALPLLLLHGQSRPLLITGGLAAGIMIYWIFSFCAALGRQGVFAALPVVFFPHLLVFVLGGLLLGRFFRPAGARARESAARGGPPGPGRL